jgi:hypothetical protein
MRDEKTGSSLDDCYTHSLLITIKYMQYSTVTDLHTFQFTIRHALGFSVSTSCLLAADLNTETITSDQYQYYT